ncbi:GNAT family N-acetyltransferase [Flavihumibacter profundi]|uniref:GNAT family N-acetyltransferase n=1 Tax=Flavihumibacter profundi TaxID=2716883 RepID=UPI001CC3E3E7|nr:GNAT family N-acetyltransferase [Flavihumibacter profundi]MBZ5856806.1 GNAT family N-acetyltransferase [Flavihumibacter profundi]
MIFIQRFVASQAQDVIDLILTIQQIEFGVPVTAADQPDLLDIPSYYFIGEGNFWVACLDGKVVGTIGLLDFGGGGFALRKMFVAKAYRGMELGIAQKLWKTALDWVSGHKGREVYLGTVELLKAAHRFYEKNGFTRIDAGQLPGRFPRMAVDTVFYVFKM